MLGMDLEYVMNYINDVIIEDEFDGFEYNGGVLNYGYFVFGFKFMVWCVFKFIKGMVYWWLFVVVDEVLGFWLVMMWFIILYLFWIGKFR